MLTKIPDFEGFDLIVMKSIVDEDMHGKMRNCVSQLKEASPKNDTLFIVLDTPGGVPMYAYRTMKLVAIEYKKVYSIIPDMSMSAGTLMALGTDAIGMLSDSCLGPLDLQIAHPDVDDITISTLDIHDTASATTLEASAVARQVLLNNLRCGVRRRTAERVATDIVSSLYKPIMDKIDPYRMHESVRNAEVGSVYGARLLASKMMKKEKYKAIKVSDKLANGYNYHGYAITRDEAEELGLSIFDAARLKAWQKILDFYEETLNNDIIGTNISCNEKEDSKC